MSNSYSTGSITGGEYVGGLVGSSYSQVSNSYSTGSITGYKRIGGLVGDNNGSVSNSFYNYDEVLINGENIITVGALFNGDFDQWLANDKFLDVNERLSQEGGYYLINAVADFKQLLAFSQDNSLKFRLKNDLDLGDEPNFYIPYLAGEFDGNGHKISNLSLDSYLVSTLGLFGCLVSGGKINQVGMENINITGKSSVGGLVGRNRGGIVTNSHSTGNVAGNHLVGGLVGSNWGTVSNSYSTSSVSGNDDVGGVAGHNVGDVISSSSTGSVTGEWGVGGLVGSNDGTVSNCYSSGNVTGDEYVGSLVGLNDWGTVNNSYSTGSVTGGEDVGGLVGGNGGTVCNSYSTGSVTGDEHVGGLVGWNDATVRKSFWDTKTSGQATSDGGTGKTTAEMQDIATFSGAGWDIIAVAPGETNDAYTWNIIDKQIYPFLSWEL